MQNSGHDRCPRFCRFAQHSVPFCGFYAARGTNLRGVQRWLCQRVLCHDMNRNVAAIRATSAADLRPLKKYSKGPNEPTARH